MTFTHSLTFTRSHTFAFCLSNTLQAKAQEEAPAAAVEIAAGDQTQTRFLVLRNMFNPAE